MDETSFTMGDLCDPRLAPHAIGASPAWLWSPDGGRVLWANPAACAAFGTETLRVLASRTFAPDTTVRVQIARLAATLPQNGTPRLQRLRGLVNQGPHLWRPLVCSCALLRLDHVLGVLVAAIEAVGPTLSLAEQVRRLDLDADTAIAAFAPSGALLFATAEGQRRLGDCATIEAIGAGRIAAIARATGNAVGDCAIGPVALGRIGIGASTVLLGRFEPVPPAPGFVARNVVPFPTLMGLGEAKPGAEHQSPALSPGEHVTFRELARQLTERLHHGESAQARDRAQAPQAMTMVAPIETGTFPSTPSAIDLNWVVRSCVAQMQTEANEGHVIVRASLSPAAPKIIADAEAVRSLVSDLLGYAIGGSRPGGQVIVSTGISPGGEVMLRLRDNGYGLSDQTIATALCPARPQGASPHFPFSAQSLPPAKALTAASYARFDFTSRPHEGSLLELTFTSAPEIMD